MEINLWECLTSIKNNGCVGEISKYIRELGKTSRWGGQELSLKPTESGWILRVFSCFSDNNTCEIVILIPKDNNKPVQILKDRSGNVEYHH